MSDRKPIRAGLFILITLVLIVGVVVLISGFDRFLEPNQQFVAEFKLSDDLGGLKVGDDIRIGGTKVGEVEYIKIDPENNLIRVGFHMPKKYPLHHNAIMRVQGTVTGSSWLNFESLGSGNTIASGSAIQGHPSQMSELLASLGDSAPEIKQVLVNVRTQTLPRVNNTLDAFKTTGQSANKLVQHVDTKVDVVTDNAAKAAGDIHNWLGPSTTDFHTTMSNIKDTTGTLKTKLPDIMDKLHETLTKVDAAMDNVKVTIGNLKDATGGIRSLLADNRSKLEAMIANLKTTSENLKNASADVWRSPWRLLYKPTPAEIGNLNLYDSTREFAEGANRLSDAAGALRDASHDPHVDQAHMQQLLDELNKAFDNFNAVEQKLWKEVK
ncbi:MAG TPA: MlaD family protein [Tepidisphaeraceae bacterium]|jgi:ABC-type transporter Mla subunit MlaD